MYRLVATEIVFISSVSEQVGIVRKYV